MRSVEDSGRSSRPDGPWHYWRPAEKTVDELCLVRGFEVALPTHFHDEHQLTLVLSGQRRFVVEDRPVVVPAGSCIWIRARTPHRSLFDPAGVECLNAYLHDGTYDEVAIRWSLERLWARGGPVDSAAIGAIAHRFRQGAATEPTPAIELALRRHRRVAEAAADVGMSRENFTRTFAARLGMSPGVYRRTARLNNARRLLRAGEPIATAAAESGFADQSHLGRWFRHAFGVTPGRYSRTSNSSQAF